MKLLVVPADPLSSYVKKGEIKKLYFNPSDIFSQITFLNFDDISVEPKEIEHSTGSAQVTIISLRPLNALEQIFPWFRFHLTKKLIRKLEVDVVRGYSPFFSGYFSLKAAKLLGVKNLVSIHSNFSELLRYYWEDRHYFRFFKYFLLSLYVEPLVLSRSNLIQPAYQHAAQYCLEKVHSKRNIKTVYNRVYSSDFYPENNENLRQDPDKLKILCVGNLDRRKGQRVLIEALSLVNFDFSLTILGQGKDEKNIKKLVDHFQLERKVTFIDSMPNNKLRNLYIAHDVFALPIEYGGLCIPAIEAAACGLAVLYPKFPLALTKEVTEGYFLSVDNTPEGFSKGLNALASDPIKLKNLKISSRFGYERVCCVKMEKEEANNYRSLIT